MSIVKKFIGADQVDGAKLLLLNNQALRAKEAGGAAVDILKVTSGDVLEIQKLPRVSSSAPAVSDDKDLVTKEYVESVLGGGAGNGYAPLGVDGKIPNQYYSSLVITDVFVVADIAARDALTGIEEGDVAKVTDAGAGLPKTYIFAGLPTGWIEIESGSDVDSVNGFTGSVVLQTGDVAESGATNRYYTPTRQSAIEAYADQAEADAIVYANSYTDSQISTLQGALEAEDLTFLKLDGSRSMAANLDLANFDLLSAGDVNAAQIITNDGINSTTYGPGSISANSLYTIDSSAGITLSSAMQPLSFSAFSSISFGATKLGGVSDGVAADDAATKGQLDALETSLQLYTDNAVEAEQLARVAEDLTFVKLDGSRPMTGFLDMDEHAIDKVSSISLKDGGTQYGSIVKDPSFDFKLASTGSMKIEAVGPIYYTAPSGLVFGGAALSNIATGIADDDAATVLQVTTAQSAAVASANSYTDGEITTLQSDLQLEDMTFVKLDGSRPMQGSLNFDSTFDINGVVQVNALRAAFSDYIEVANQLTFTSTGSIQFGMSDGVINGLAAFTGTEDAAQATPKSYVDSQKTAAVSEAETYTDGQLDLLSVQELVHESKTLGAGDLTSISVADAIQGQPWIQVGRVSLVPGDDFTVSGSTITWAGSVAPAGAEALEAGDKVSIFYMKAVQPYV